MSALCWVLGGLHISDTLGRVQSVPVTDLHGWLRENMKIWNKPSGTSQPACFYSCSPDATQSRPLVAEQESNLFLLSWGQNKLSACSSCTPDYLLLGNIDPVFICYLFAVQVTYAAQCGNPPPTHPPLKTKQKLRQTRLLPKQTTPPSCSPWIWAPQYRLISYFTTAQCGFSPVFLPPFTPVHLLIYQPAPWRTYYCNVKAGKRPTTGRSASGDWVRDWMALPVSHP